MHPPIRLIPLVARTVPFAVACRVPHMQLHIEVNAQLSDTFETKPKQLYLKNRKNSNSKQKIKNKSKIKTEWIFLYVCNRPLTQTDGHTS